MVRIKLARRGAKKRAFYHIVASDNKGPRDGRFLEKLGYYDPLKENICAKVNLNLDGIEKWQKCGAQLSHRVKCLIRGYNRESKKRVLENESSSND